MRLARLLVTSHVACLATMLFCGASLASQSVRLKVSLRPDRLGAFATIFVGFRISGIPPAGPAPLTGVNLLLPGEVGLATSGLGLENCVVTRLEEWGPSGCPADARMGSGTATAEIPIAGEVVAESAQVEVFSAPVRDGHLGLLVYANAYTPVSAQLVFPASVVDAPSPFSESIDTIVPLVPSLPGAPDVAVNTFHMTLGSPHAGPGRFFYYRRVRGRPVPYSPRGLLLPSTCPHGGFRFEARFSFQGQPNATAQATAACPRRAH